MASKKHPIDYLEIDFWKSSTEESLKNWYDRFVELGMKEAEAVSLIAEIYYTIGEEYGD